MPTKRVVALTGTPGTGKTTVSRMLAKRGWNVLELNRAIVKQKLYTRWDARRATFIADMSAVRNFVKQKIKFGNWIVVSHLSHLLPPKMIDVVIVLRCRPETLAMRLRRKRWSKSKINENVEAEFIGLIASEARQKHKQVFEIDTTRRSSSQTIAAIEKVLKGSGESYRKSIDWLM
ncbi:MAG: adenylate kinase family protein [Candidatus Aenigmatarchaeota archaeon]|nr:adenylate kinase family protein [Candidatus Aenigmarchaeota archaeon]